MNRRVKNNEATS